MSLSKLQQEFTEAIAELIIFAKDSGYKLTFGDAYRDPRVHGEMGDKESYSSANSVHKLRLAVDFNLFVGGNYIQSDAHPAWEQLHKAWEILGGAKRIPNDANHFSFEYNGAR